jgi:hypothetical protein
MDEAEEKVTPSAIPMLPVPYLESIAVTVYVDVDGITSAVGAVGGHQLRWRGGGRRAISNVGAGS